MDASDALALLIPIVAIAGFFLVVAVWIASRTRVRELEIRQRIAMIEKGLVPPPEVDPGRFERALQVHEVLSRRVPSRHRSVGITLVGIGLGLMVLISIAGGDPSSGIGVGGAIVILGLAFFANGLFEARGGEAPGQGGAGHRPSEPTVPSDSGVPHP